MENETNVPAQAAAANSEWTATKVYLLSAICLFLGLVIGALFHGPAKPAAPAAGADAANASNMTPDQIAKIHQGVPGMNGQVDPVIEKVKQDPKNFDLLVAAGNASMKVQDAKSAEDYYSRALEVKNVPDVRIDLANAAFRDGDADRSLTELATVLQADPKNDKALYNTGVVLLMGKSDAKGAIASWQTLLKYYPNHPQKQKVEEMISKVKEAKAKGQLK